jgi:hypothetical protein
MKHLIDGVLPVVIKYTPIVKNVVLKRNQIKVDGVIHVLVKSMISVQNVDVVKIQINLKLVHLVEVKIKNYIVVVEL